VSSHASLADGVAAALNEADSIIIPGYMTVAQSAAVGRLTRKLRAAGKTVRFAIHRCWPFARSHRRCCWPKRGCLTLCWNGREINEDFAKTDVAIVIGSTTS
jgi:NAD(P) transhydrogenase subunit beta